METETAQQSKAIETGQRRWSRVALLLSGVVLAFAADVDSRYGLGLQALVRDEGQLSVNVVMPIDEIILTADLNSREAILLRDKTGGSETDRHPISVLSSSGRGAIIHYRIRGRLEKFSPESLLTDGELKMSDPQRAGKVALTIQRDSTREANGESKADKTGSNPDSNLTLILSHEAP